MEQTNNVKSLTDYIDIIKKNCEKEKVSQYDSNCLFYRGHSKKSFKLLPSIARNIEECSFDKRVTNNFNLLKYENELIWDAINYFPELMKSIDRPFELLSILQHFGLPTRLLDLTENALVALYFASEKDEDDEDGEVICFSFEKRNNSTMSFVNAIADSYSIIRDEAMKLKDFYETVKTKQYYQKDDRIESFFGEMTDMLGKLIQRDIFSQPTFSSSRYILERQRAQMGAYYVFPNSIENGCFVNSISPIDDDRNIIDRIIICKESKASIRCDLESIGITKKTLFPDSKDIVFRELKNDYLKKMK